MKLLIMACLSFLPLLQMEAASSPDTFRPVDGDRIRGQFIDIDLKTSKRLWVRYNAIADTGVELELTEGSKLIWRAYVERLNVSHSAYQQSVDAGIDFQDKNKINVTSTASGGNIFEVRSLKTGKCLSRRVTNKHSPLPIP